MKIKSKHEFKSCNPEQVWEKLMDIDLLGSIIADGRGLNQVGPNMYRGRLPVSLGPIRGNLRTTLKLKNLSRPKRFNLKVYGKWYDQRVSGKGTFTLSKNGCSTKVKYRGRLTIFMRGPLGVRIDHPGPMQVMAQDHVERAINALFREIDSQCCEENGYAH